ncbi:sensor histidine kinase [Streptococcus australis]|uniref:sensor histidine kinase n=1 Tax=Streptococcus australis TaxID=113107 RepID=UPI000F6799A1|nr:sensor histidine kinase [Streptococcus australis]RSJ97401.1 Sensor histidine kinase YpdA [Streptococcus australis]
MKKIWLATLLKFYAYIMVGIITTLGVTVSLVYWHNQRAETDRIAQLISSRLTAEVEDIYKRSSQWGKSLVENPAKLEGVYKYFSLTPSEYESWRLDNYFSNYIQVSLHRNVETLYLEHDALDEIDLVLNDYTTVFVSSKSKKGGQQVPADQYVASSQAIPVPLTDVTTGEDIGLAYIKINPALLDSVVDNIQDTIPVVVQIYNPLGKDFYHRGDIKPEDHNQWIVRDTAYGYQIWVGIPTSYTVRTALFSFTWMISVALILVLVLYLLLQRIFRNYQKQVLDLVDTMEAISQGDSERRINVDTKEQELLLVAEMTNTMLDNMDKSIRDIYQLQLSQKDANMKALQAQINPHFMYNTMEFIRMYAVMQDQEELADIIYEFSSLLRNNISEEKETTIENELEFCRKYSYLCMVRYPKSIAYGFKIETGLEEMVIPKFTLQPLVENYFVHGVDHKRKDNVISIKVRHVGETVEIRVQDNGRGMEPSQLQRIQQILSHRGPREEVEESKGRQSIGIVNVHERFRLYFGDRYHIQITSEKGKGVLYTITIEDT